MVYSEDEILSLLSGFASDFLGQVDTSDWPDSYVTLGPKRDKAEVHKLGFRLSLQLMGASYNHLLSQVKRQQKCCHHPLKAQKSKSSLFTVNRNSANFVPDTMEIGGADDLENKKPKCPNLVVPETQQVQDEKIRAKYGELDCVTLTKAERNNVTSQGLFGTGGPSPTSFNQANGSRDEENESPSILSHNALNIRRLIKNEYDDDEDDFKTDDVVTKKAIPSLSNKHKKAENKWGMKVEPITDSQLKRSYGMKQGKLDLFLKPKCDSKRSRTSNHQDDIELQKAIELSKMEEERRLLKANTDNLDDSFDCLGSSGDKEELPYKYVSSPVRKRNLRKQLEAFDCKDCREFYANANMNEEQLQKALQQCSRHRAKHAPPQNSPETRWKLDIDEDCTQNKTQVGSPFKTRAKRKFRPN